MRQNNQSGNSRREAIVTQTPLWMIKSKKLGVGDGHGMVVAW